MSVLSGSVGKGGSNGPGDVRLVQHLLNDNRGKAGLTLLVVDGLVGPKTTGAIELFQRSNGLTVDGRVDVHGGTIKALVNGHLKSISGGVLSLGLKGSKKPKLDSATTAAALEAYLAQLKKL